MEASIEDEELPEVAAAEIVVAGVVEEVIAPCESFQARYLDANSSQAVSAAALAIGAEELQEEAEAHQEVLREEGAEVVVVEEEADLAQRVE